MHRVAEKRQAVDEFLRHRRVPRSLADKVLSKPEARACMHAMHARASTVAPCSSQIRNYYAYIAERELHAEEEALIAGLSANLRTQVRRCGAAHAACAHASRRRSRTRALLLHPPLHSAPQLVLHIYQEALEKVPFFRDRHPSFTTHVVSCLRLQYFAPVMRASGSAGRTCVELSRGQTCR